MKLPTCSSPTGILLLAGLAPLIFTTWAADPAAAQPVRPLTAEQVDCSADQLRAMLGRSAILFGPAYDERAAMFLFSYGSPTGDLSGMALVEQHDLDGNQAGTEHQLAFAVTPSHSRLLRNPSRPQLNTMYLLRDRLSSDTSRLEDSYAMAVVVDPTLEPLKNDDPFTLLVIDNLNQEEGGVGSDAKVGRGLQAVLAQCQNQYTQADLHVFQILARTLRATAWETRSPQAGRLHKLASVFRGAEAHPIGGGVRATYRIDLYPVQKDQPLGRVSIEMDIDMADDGALGEARMRVLPACASAGQRHCSTATSQVDLSVIKPMFGNQTWSQPAPTVCWKGPADCSSEVSFSFAERLQGTTWLRP
ncbi:MAG TPA: hypothetical protein VJ885_17980 [Thermoanaerobaculia bacterium]|nr:hypothetical protein [Thermoanaerobaculia bacterium]